MERIEGEEGKKVKLEGGKEEREKNERRKAKGGKKVRGGKRGE